MKRDILGSLYVLRFTRPRIADVALAVLLACIVWMTALISAPEAANEKVSSNGSNKGSYVVNLISSPEPVKIPSLSGLVNLDKHLIYSTRIEKQGETFYRLRLGFFNSEDEAKQVLNTTRARYKEAWIVKVSTEERDLAIGVAQKHASVTTEGKKATTAPVQTVAQDKPVTKTMPATSEGKGSSQEAEAMKIPSGSKAPSKRR